MNSLIIVLGIIGLVVGFFMVRQCANYSLNIKLIIAFIMVTSENNKEILLKAIKAGVSDFVAKPVDEDMLFKKMDALLK